MRPYRAIPIGSKDFVYGDVIYANGGAYIFDGNKGSFVEDDELSAFNLQEVIPETVGQQTGRRDKNKDEIYEGDKIKFGDNKFWCVVVWNDKGFYQLWRNTMINWTLWIDDYYHNSGHRKDLEIVGNIHQHPELVGGVK